MTQVKTTKKTTQPRKTSAMSSTPKQRPTNVDYKVGYTNSTKHGNGLDQAHVAGVTDREFREHKASLQYSTTHLWVVGLATALVAVILMYLTNRWYGL